MSAIYIMLPISLLLAFGFLAAYIWSVRSGQFEDTQTPAMRILPDDKPISAKRAIRADAEPGSHPGGRNPARVGAVKTSGKPAGPSTHPGDTRPPSSGKMPDATFRGSL